MKVILWCTCKTRHILYWDGLIKPNPTKQNGKKEAEAVMGFRGLHGFARTGFQNFSTFSKSVPILT